jgi:hypothetical protein
MLMYGESKIGTRLRCRYQLLVAGVFGNRLYGDEAINHLNND